MPLRKISSLATFNQRQKEIRQNKIKIVETIKKTYDLTFHSTREYFDEPVGLGRKCDWYIKKGLIKKHKNTNEPKTIFLVSDNYKNHINFVDNILPTLTKKFILIVAGQDYTWPLGKLDNEKNIIFNDPEWHKRIDILLNSDKILKIFVENLDMDHPKLEPFPLGLCFAKLNEFYLSILNELVEVDYKKKDIDVLCQHNTHPAYNNDELQWHYNQFNDRLIFNEQIKNNKLIKYKEPANKNIRVDCPELQEFKDNVLRSDFVICIHGGGIDPCPKVFESILMGAIPIIEKSTVSSCFKLHNLPVVIVDKIDNTIFTEKNLDKWYDLYESYYSDKNKRRETLYKLSDMYWWDYFTSFLD